MKESQAYKRHGEYTELPKSTDFNKDGLKPGRII